MISFKDFMRIIELAETVKTDCITTDKKGLKQQGDFTDLTYDNFYNYCRYMSHECGRPKTPADILKIAEDLGF